MRVLKAHRTLLLVTVCISLVYGSHHVFVPLMQEQEVSYYPVTLASSDDEAAFYGPRARTIFDGQLRAGDIDLARYSNVPSALPLLNPLLMGSIGRVLGSMAVAFIVADFLFPPLIFLLVYYILFELTLRKRFSLVVAVLFIFIPTLGLFVPPTSLGAARDFFMSVVPFLTEPSSLYFSRFEYPQVTYLFYGLAFLFLIRAIKREDRRYVFAAGIAFGTLFYTYFYDWMYFLAGLGFMALFFLLQREYQSVKRVLFVAGIGLIVSLPYWINFARLASLPHYADIAGRIGLEISSRIRLSAWTTYARVLVLGGALFAVIRKSNMQAVGYLLGFLLAITAVLNVQVITGFSPQPDHWHRTQFLIVFASIMMIGLWLYDAYGQYFFENFRRHTTIFTHTWLVLIVLIVGTQLFSQYQFSRVRAEAFSVEPSYAAAYVWLGEHTLKDSVVGTISPETNNELRLHTHNKIFVPNGLNTLAPNEEIWSRYLFMSRVFGVGAGDFEEAIGFDALPIRYLFHNYYRTDKSLDSYLRGSVPHDISDGERAILKREYQKLAGLLPIEVRAPYRLEYLIAGPRENALGRDPSAVLPFLQTVYKNDAVRIYGWNLQ